MIQEREMLTKLAIGLLQQQQNASPVTRLNHSLHQGWEALSVMCFNYGILPPLTLPELVEWLHTPVEQWNAVGTIIQSTEIKGKLLEDGYPTGLTYQLGEPFVNTYNPHMEMEDASFRRIREWCYQHGKSGIYTQVREFINRNPVLPDVHQSITASLDWNDELRVLLRECYEFVPPHCVRSVGGQQVVFLCPHCGWTLSWRRNEAFCHSGGTCAELSGDLSETAKVIPFEPQVMIRTTEGIQRYVVAPEVALIQLFDRVKGEWGLLCELYPAIDAYDVRIVLPSGKRWAVDVKDWKRPESLAVNIERFRILPQWDHAFYVFPDYRAQTSNYVTAFKNYWKPQKGVTPVSYRDFLKLLLTEIG